MISRNCNWTQRSPRFYPSQKPISPAHAETLLSKRSAIKFCL
jgi:hypothetical protein